MNFSYAVIAIVGVLVAISIGFIAVSPDDIPEPRIVDVTASIIDIDESKIMEKDEGPIACTLEWNPMCGVDGITYGNPCAIDAADVKLDYEGECIVPEPVVEEVMETEAAPEPVVEEVMETEAAPEPVVEEVMETEAAPEPVVEEVMETEAVMNAIVVIPPGVAVPGCDDTDECYLPYDVSVATGATVLWSNDDSAAHTVSSGTIDAGLTGVFDSGLFMAGGSFEFTFDTPGDYDYFCMVHPWMTGIVSVS
ncbi:MAG: hypothetical protein HOM82_00175 [Thaumarchaeota archaeon]|nr:hypothetical protein [Nitrososphaerota archaeon]